MSYYNKSRGLRIDGTEFEYITEGDYGAVFKDSKADRIWKVYFSNKNCESLCRTVFDSERQAYEICYGSQILRDLVPGGYTQREPPKIIDRDGMDVTREFFPCLAFQAEFIKGKFLKINELRQQLSEEVSRITKLLTENCVHGVDDISVTLSDQGRILKVIDFSKTILFYLCSR
jgi:hypothetical protein